MCLMYAYVLLFAVLCTDKTTERQQLCKSVAAFLSSVTTGIHVGLHRNIYQTKLAAASNLN